MSTIQTSKLIRIKRKHGQTLQVVREHYLRENVPCRSALCCAGCEEQSSNTTTYSSLLPDDVTHYVVPDVDTLLKYLEILELNEISGILLTQTASNGVQQEGGKKHYQRLQNLIKNPLKKSALCYNEFQRYAYCPRQPKETSKDWQNRSIYEACVWYYNHLIEQMPLVMITTDEDVVKEYGSRHLGVFVVTVKQYLKQFYPDLEQAVQLYESLTLSWEINLSKDKDFTGYLPSEVLDTGIKSGAFVVGSLQVSKHNASNEAFVRRKGRSGKSSENAEDILISGAVDRNRAVHGDSVVVEILPKIQWKSRSNALKENTADERDDAEDESDVSNTCPTGRVVGVMQRNWREYVVSIAQEQQGDSNRAGKILVIPWDWRIPKIRISTRQVETLKNQRCIVRIDNWEVDSQYPNGHFVRSLGPVGHLETEISALLIENTITVGPFMESVLKEMPVNSTENPWKMSKKEIKRRRDLRNSHLIFSIDPKGCEDVDDTLSVRRLKNGNLELGVHIADVTHFVRPNSACDLEARSRSTTVYLADRRYDMLPAVLSSDLCSLISGVDRYAVSVIWELDPQYEVKHVWYGRTVIRSKYKLFYEIAQEMQEGATDSALIANIPELQSLSADEQTHALKELREAVSMLMETARQIRAKRTVQGALELEGVEVRVQMSETKSIQDLIPKQTLEIHETIAECMIFANHWVAKKICQSFPNQALLRHHPLPREEHFQNLINCARSQGFEIQTHSNKALADSLDKCVSLHDPEVNKILRTLATQAMSNAAYFSTGTLPRDQFFHYGLALDFYTHFTSPIRRYADVIVHRLLLAATGAEELSVLLPNRALDELSSHINHKHRAAQYAQRDSQELFQTLFFKDRPSDDDACVVNAIIFEIRSNGLKVFVPRYGIKGAVYLRSKDGQVVYVPHDGPAEWVGGTLSQTTDSVTVNSIFGTQRYKLFDHVTVRVTVQEMHAHPSSLKLELLYNKMHLSNDELFEAKSQKGAMIKKVQQEADKKRQEQEDLVDLGENFLELKKLYGQTEPSKSLYALLQSFQEAALLDV